MESFKDLAREKAKDLEYRKNTIRLVGADPMSSMGFTQVPNFILEKKNLTVGAKMTYSMLLRYAREKDSCFPGQKTIAEMSGMGERSINRYIGELQEKGFISINRRGLGKPNIYSLHIRVTKKNTKVSKKR